MPSFFVLYFVSTILWPSWSCGSILIDVTGFEDDVPCIEPKPGSDDYLAIPSLTKSTILDPKAIMPIHEVYPNTVHCMQLCILGCIDLSFVLQQQCFFNRLQKNQFAYGGFVCTLPSITIFVNLGLFRHFSTFTNIRTSIKSNIYWGML